MARVKPVAAVGRSRTAKRIRVALPRVGPRQDLPGPLTILTLRRLCSTPCPKGPALAQQPLAAIVAVCVTRPRSVTRALESTHAIVTALGVP